LKGKYGKGDMVMEQELLRMVKINKSFPGVCALKDVDFDLYEGEIHALVGENGAGKSTLMNILAGMLQKDGGEIFINGVKVEIASPSFAIKNSIGMVPQELNIVPEISIAENICMGTQSRKAGFLLDWKDIYKKAKKIMEQLGLTIDPRKIVGMCSVAQLQMVQIGRALAFGAKIIVLDEPTSSLTYHEKIALFEVMRQLKANGVGLVFITHHLDEVKEISDRVTVMQDGERIDTTYVKDTSIGEIITKMVGHNVVFSKFNRNFESNDVILEVKDLCHKTDYRNVSFKIKRGEIFGVAGLVGAGRTELMLTIFGSNPAESGSIFFNGKEVSIKSPKEAIDLGIGYLPEERRTQGIFPEMSVCENLTMPILRRLCKHGVVDRKEQNEITRKYIREYDIKTPSIEKQIRDLSGGNQQKVIFARWIEKDMDLLILDESTRGIDVSTKEEIHKLIETLAQKGKTIVVVSSEAKELLNVSDRIMVMNEGEIKGILNAHETSQQDILSLALD
jgi:ABC-type sugar transport system ATPase subunit